MVQSQTGQLDKKLRFNCYLLQDGLSDVNLALRPKYQTGGGSALTELAAAPTAPDGTRAFLGSNEPKRPPWAEHLNAAFPGTDRIYNTSHRLIVFLPVENRWFAVCFGYGSSALDWDKVEANFGLRVAARKFDPKSIQELRSRRVDFSARTQSVTVPAGGQLSDFGVVLEGEFVRKIIGRLDSETADGSPVVAGDSIMFRANVDLRLIQEDLRLMLQEVVETSVKDEFALIDSLTPLRNSESTAGRLDSYLASELLQEEGNRTGDLDLQSQVLEFAPPDDVRIEDVEIFQIRYRNKVAQFDIPDISALREALASAGARRGVAFLKSVKIIALSADGLPASGLLPLRHWLIFEASEHASRFILTLGRWFQLNEDYTEKLTADLRKIRDVTNTLKLAEWNSKWYEKEYNNRAVLTREDLINLDRELCMADDGGLIESCDLFHQDGFLIHVKRYNGSQTLSHLFSQGAVSAELLNSDATFKNEFCATVKLRSASMLKAANVAPRNVTYAIGVTKGRALPDDLPTFSKVNLRDHSRRLKVIGVEPSIATVRII